MEIKTEKGVVFIPDYRQTNGMFDVKKIEKIHIYKGFTSLKEDVMEIKTEKGKVYIPDYKQTSGMLDLEKISFTDDTKK